jgi:pimeloyl-ACP methyl ester carboxylesterase/protein-L-isoaspartate O-methyltransferase
VVLPKRTRVAIASVTVQAAKETAMTTLRQQLLTSAISAHEHTYELAGISTPVLEVGHGPPIVLLHGPGEHAAKWFRVLPDLASTHRVIAPDLPGHGESRVTGTLDLARTLAWLGELVERTCARPPTLVAQLVAGAIAARFASRYSDRLAALVLVDTLGLRPFQPAPEFMASLTAYMLNPTPTTHDALWEGCAFDLARLRRELGWAWDVFKAYNLERATDETLHAHQEALMQTFGLPALEASVLDAIRVPTTLIWGRHDLVTPVSIAQATSVRQRWNLHVIEGAADDPAFEQSEAFVSTLRAALSRVEWDRIAPGYDRTNTATQMQIADEALQRAGLQAGMRLLDIAAGSGALSIPAARRGARVVAIDQSSRMLELLTERAKREQLALEAAVMDAQHLELEAATFDITASQFGVMLVPDLERAVSEMARVTKPGGCVLLSVYGDPREIDFLGFFVRAVRSVRPDFDGPPSDPPPLEFRLAHPDRLRDMLTVPGLTDVRVETVRESTTFATGEQLWDWIISSNPIVEHILAMLEITDEERNTIRSALDELLRERARATGTATLTNPVHIGIARKAA